MKSYSDFRGLHFQGVFGFPVLAITVDKNLLWEGIERNSSSNAVDWCLDRWRLERRETKENNGTRWNTQWKLRNLFPVHKTKYAVPRQSHVHSNSDIETRDALPISFHVFKLTVGAKLSTDHAMNCFTLKVFGLIVSRKRLERSFAKKKQ